jgi:branched-chain amino acid transport system ATP-binding protein
MLEIRGLAAGYGQSIVLHDIDLSVGRGELIALIGANGAGKSTLVKTLMGLLPTRAGTISFEGQDIGTLSPAARVLRGLALVPEGRQVFGGLTVQENLRLGAYARRGLDEAALSAQMKEACEPFPMLLSRLGAAAANLSGGQQQMLAIARGLMAAPRLLLLDEPSLGLSPALVTEIFRLVTTLRERGISILLSEQNARQSLAIADRAYVLENGRITLAGRSADIMAAEGVAEKYLGVGQGMSEQALARQRALSAKLARILERGA